MARTLVDVLQTRAQESPDKLAFLFLIDGETEGPRVTYSELDAQARAIAVALRNVSAEQDRALLVYQPGLDFIAAFFGCLYAGVTAVPVYPPRSDFLRLGLPSLASFAADCQAAVILGNGEMLKELRPTLPSNAALDRIRLIATDDVALHSNMWRPAAIDPQSLAMLQYTSGSTAAPRGVMVTHANLIHNEQTITAAFREPGMGVCWLPPYHDMGLIGGILLALFQGSPCVLMSPWRFLQRPYRWLAAISRYRADTSGGPGFAYDFCVERTTAEERRSLDLSHWKVAAIGSEPVRPTTVQRFAATFAESGFRSEAFFPCYGLAEATLLVTGGLAAAGPRVLPFDRRALESGWATPASDAPEGQQVDSLVGCGQAVGGQRLAIVDPDTCLECEPGRVGETWLAGPSVARGYWNRPEETQATFQAFLAPGREGPMLRTGDLGFVLGDELFITGRLKDLIIIHGRNHAPQDIEGTVQGVHAGLRLGCGAAFEVQRNGEPKLVMVQEVDPRHRNLDPARLIGEVREAVSMRHGVQLYELLLLEPASILRTSSGKVQRHACRAAYENGALRLWKSHQN